MGASINGAGTSKITITGVKELNAVEYEAIGDRIEAATYIFGALMTESEVKVEGMNPKHIGFVLDTLKDMGANLEIGEDFVLVRRSKLKPVKIKTAPYPGFPTDLQAQMMALMTKIPGNSYIEENIFENRFMHVPELVRLGAKINLSGNSAFVEGGRPLKAAPVMCTDLRASAALVLAALVSEGETEVRRVYHLDRGYEKLDQKLNSLGAKVKKVNE